MGIERFVSTPVAILVGSCIVGLGLYFGLAHRAAPVPSPPVPVPPAASTAAPPATSEAPVTQVDEVRKQVAAAMAAKKPTIVERCWKPALAKQAEPKQGSWTFNFSFDASGKQLMRGVVEDRQRLRHDVTACIGDVLGILTIPPPGGPVFVEVPFELP